jgi:hypothetical protein
MQFRWKIQRNYKLRNAQLECLKHSATTHANNALEIAKAFQIEYSPRLNSYGLGFTGETGMSLKAL